MKVSIIIPAYNAAAFLERSVSAALAQEYPDIEIIIVDNNSTDTSLKLAQQLQQRHPKRIQVVQESLQGCSAARNAGMKASSGDWLQFLDADDTISPTKLIHQLSLLGPETKWVIAGYQHLYPDGSTEDSTPSNEPWKGLVHNFAIGNTCANLYHRSALESIGGWDTSLADNTDHNLHFHLLQKEVVYVLDPAINMTYHHHGGQRVSTRDELGRLRRKATFHQEVNNFLKQHRSNYFKQNAPFFKATHLHALRMLATLDPETAAEQYQLAYPNGHGDIDHSIVSHFVSMYDVLGFEKTENLRLALAPLLPSSWKTHLKSWLSR